MPTNEAAITGERQYLSLRMRGASAAPEIISGSFKATSEERRRVAIFFQTTDVPAKVFELVLEFWDPLFVERDIKGHAVLPDYADARLDPRPRS